MKITIKVITVLFALWGSLMILETVYDFGLMHNQNIKLSAISNSPPSVPLLIHGPCEPLWMISPALLDPHTGITSYNLALSHSDFADNYLHLYLYLKHNKAPRYLLLYVTPESLDRSFNTFNSYRFAPYLSDSVVRATVKENDPDYFRWCSFPFMKYAYYNNKFSFDVLQGFKHYLTGRTKAYYPDGFEPPAKRAWGNHAGDFADLYHNASIFIWDTLREKYLVKTLQLAKSRGIKVYLYESPVLFESLASQLNRDQVIAKIRLLAQEQSVSFIQFDQLPMAKQKEYFVSTLNFNMAGVKIFNDTLGKYIRTCILKPDATK